MANLQDTDVLPVGRGAATYKATFKDVKDSLPAAPDASDTVKGVVELATAAETTTGSDATRAVTPAGLKVELDKKAADAPDGSAAGSKKYVRQVTAAADGSGGFTQSKSWAEETLYPEPPDGSTAGIKQYVRQVATTGTATLAQAKTWEEPSFTQAGTGAVTRSIESKLRDVVSVKDFGAKGDGVTDDTAAIQAAINAANKIILPAGNTFKTTSDITVLSDKHIAVEGILTRTGSGAARAFLLNGNNIRIDGSGEIRGPQFGLTISYAADQSAIFNTPDLTLTTQLKNITIANLTISGWGDAGVEMWDVDGLSCTKLTLHDIGRIGLQTLTGKNITYSDNYVYDIGPGGGGTAPFLNAYGMSVSSDTSIVVPRPTNVKICNNTVIGIEHWEAYDFHGVDGAIIQNNTAIDCMIGIYVGPSTGGNNQNCDNVVVDGNYLNNLGSTYSRAGIIVAPGYTTSQYGENIVVSDNVIVGHGANQATYDAGYASTDGEGSIYVVRTRNCVVNSNVVTSPYQIGIHSRAQNLGTTISSNRVDSPVTANGEAVCFKGNDSNACIVNVVGNTWQRLSGSSSAVTITGTPVSTQGYRYSESNEHIGNFVSVFTGSSYSLLHSSSSYLSKLLCTGRVSLTGSGATLISGFNVTSVTRQAQGVVRVVIDVDGIDANYALSVTPQSGTFASATYNSPLAGQFDILLWDSTTTLVDIPFSFEVCGSAV